MVADGRRMKGSKADTKAAGQAYRQHLRREGNARDGIVGNSGGVALALVSGRLECSEVGKVPSKQAAKASLDDSRKVLC